MSSSGLGGTEDWRSPGMNPPNSLPPIIPGFVNSLEFIRRVRPSACIGTLMSLVLPLTVTHLAVRP